MSLYTDEISKLMYEAKARLPSDFALKTIDMEHYIIIDVPMENFAWRTVEDRLAIALVLERLRQLVSEAGIGCVIQKS